jgi:hypothetical protein
MSVLLLGRLILTDNSICQIDDIPVLVLLDHMQGLASECGRIYEPCDIDFNSRSRQTHVCITSAGVMHVLLAISSILISSFVSNNIPTMTSAQ